LDEATSAVDAQSESLIHQCLGDFVKGRTVFLITHSVTAQILEFATRIVVLEQGQLLATGSHEELLQSCPAYQRLHHAQTSGRSGDSLGEFPVDATNLDDAGQHGSAAAGDPQVIKFAAASESHDALRKAN
ncbi:MAG TPA: hypothetical protein VK137_17555, partial [Planctomycetaceae bacterium]|nr:hypothetical protein [Planctomycetaceae bacterium]